ncbi:tyrosinase [Malassezia cuniculi]|uniref:Tyrosinase n=1 Tax=Malassezia cuniculi TaxID=948313 RepID=A0AAF0J4P5_9BASI|nr:tyrosinase [Malassezia cuniculi]
MESLGGANPRLERMRAALDKFLELIDHKANQKNFAIALPGVDPKVVESARVKFVHDLKEAIKGDLASLIDKYELDTRLGQLHNIAHEADERQKQAYPSATSSASSAATHKDIWRPDIDVATAVRARVDADAEPRIAALTAELEQLQAANNAARARVEELEQQAAQMQEDTAAALALVDQLVAHMSHDPAYYMSIDLDWPLLTKELSGRLHERINGLFAGIELPEYLGELTLQSFDLGSDAPNVRLARIGDVWPEFRDAAMAGSVAAPSSQPASRRLRTFRQYDDDMPQSVDWETHSMSEADESMTSSWSFASEDMAMPRAASRPMSLTSLPDAQIHVAVHWPTTSIRAVFTGSLQMYYSDARLLSLPLTLTLTALEFVAQIVVAADADTDSIYITIVEDESTSALLQQPVPWQARRRSSKLNRILPYLAFDSRVGEPEKHVLENVVKVEKFAGDVIRQVLESELCSCPIP